MADYVSPGAAFGSAFDSFLMAREQQKRQTMLDDLAQKREARLVQAEIDSQNERTQELQRRKAKDEADLHDKQVASLEKRVSNMVKGDRPDPEMVQEAQRLGLAGVFRQQAPAMSTEPMQPPAALAAEPPAAGAPVEGATVPTPEGAMTAGPVVYPGSPKERLDEQTRARQQKFIDQLPEGDQRKQELSQALEAESVGLKVPPGYFTKPTPAKTRLIFDPVARKYTDATGKVITDVPENAVVDRAAEPKDHSASNAAAQNHVDSIREHAYTELNTRAKPIEEQINNLNKLTTSLDENSSIADSTLAEQIIKVTAGGAGSGVRITLPEIEQVLKKSRTKWDDLQVALNKWATSSPDQKQQDLFYTPQQKQAMRDLVRAYRTKANVLHKQIIDTRHQIDSAPDVSTINKVRTRAEEDIFSEPTAPAAPTKKRTAAEILAGL